MKKVLVAIILCMIFIGGVAFAAKLTSPDVNQRRGCCSHHGGVSYCGTSGYYVCNDGTRSPSCRCR